jgi:hypothetical protein
MLLCYVLCIHKQIHGFCRTSWFRVLIKVFKTTGYWVFIMDDKVMYYFFFQENENKIKKVFQIVEKYFQIK